MDDVYPADSRRYSRLGGMAIGQAIRVFRSRHDGEESAFPAEHVHELRRSATEHELRIWIERYTPMLLPLARAFAGGADDAEDILQVVWIKAFESAHARSARAPIERWLRRVTLNEGRSRLRRRQRRQRLMALWRPDATTEAGFSPDGSDQFMEMRTWRAIGNLPSLQRQVVMLRVFEDLSVKETATELGRREGTIKASLHRALKRLRRELAPLMEDVDESGSI